MGTIHLSPEQDAVLEKFKARCNVSSSTELVNAAFSLLQWAITERENGHQIASVNQGQKHLKFLQMDLLEDLPPGPHATPVPRFAVIQGDRDD